MLQYKKLLVAVDFSDPSVRALQVAMRLAAGLQAELTVIYVAKMDNPDSSEHHLKGDMAIEAKLLASFRSELEEFIHRASDDKVHTSIDVKFGDATEQINLAASEMGADIIVIGTHGRTGLEHLLMGSIAESVLQSANVPVMCISN